MGTCPVDQDDLKLSEILVPLPPKYRDHRHEPPCLAQIPPNSFRFSCDCFSSISLVVHWEL